MNYRHSVILAAEQITTAATKTIDINLQDPISRLLVSVRLLNTTYSPVGHPCDTIKKIEIVDGSNVIFSASGCRAQAMAHFISGKWDHNELNAENNGWARSSMSIYFGRELWDEELALDPKQFHNLQLKITHDYSLGACTPDDAYLAVHADLFDEKVPSLRGFLMTKDHIEFLPATGSVEYVDLPTDYLMMLLAIINTNDAEAPDVEFEKIKLTEDHDKRVIFDGLCLDFIHLAALQYGVTSDLFCGRADTTPFYYYLSQLYDVRMNVLEQTAVDTYLWAAWTGGRKRGIDCGAQVEFNGEAVGLCPHGAVPINFGKRMNIDDWWDVSKIGSARLALTPRADPAIDANKNTFVTTVQMKPY